MSGPPPSAPWASLTGVKPSSMKTISDSKLATFAVGQQKKSRFQKAREEAEEKKRIEELETSKLYDTFVASFESDDNSKTFVRGSSGAGHPGRAGDVYRLQSHNISSTVRHEPSSSKGSGRPMKEMDRMLQEMKVLCTLHDNDIILYMIGMNLLMMYVYILFGNELPIRNEMRNGICDPQDLEIEVTALEKERQKKS